MYQNTFFVKINVNGINFPTQRNRQIFVNENSFFAYLQFKENISTKQKQNSPELLLYKDNYYKCSDDYFSREKNQFTFLQMETYYAYSY